MKHSFFTFNEENEHECEFRISTYFINDVQLSELEFNSIRKVHVNGEYRKCINLLNISKPRFRELAKLGVLIKVANSPYAALYKVEENFKKRMDEIAKELKAINTMIKAEQWSLDNGYELMFIRDCRGGRTNYKNIQTEAVRLKMN